MKNFNKTQPKQETKDKVLDNEKDQTDNRIVALKELESIKNYLLSQKEKPLTNENIKVMQKIYEPKKAVGGAK